MDNLPDSLRAATFGRFNSASGVGFIVGPLIGGHLAELDADGFTCCALVCTALFLLNLGQWAGGAAVVRVATFVGAFCGGLKLDGTWAMRVVVVVVVVHFSV